MNYKLIVALILIVLSVLFVVQNTVVVQIQLLFWKIEMSRALMVLLFLAIGIVVGWLLRGHILRRSRR